MGLHAGLGVLVLQPMESWQGVQVLASARVMWLAGCWLLAGILWWGCSGLCLPHRCLLAGWCWRLVGKGPDGPQLALVCWQSHGNLVLLARLASPMGSHHGMYPAKRGFHLPPWACWGHSVLGRMPWRDASSEMQSPPPSLGCHVSWKLLAWESEHMQKHKMYWKCQAGALEGDPSSLTCAVKITI